MRTFFLFLAALPALAQSHPTWWGLAPSGATAIVGIQWKTVRSSPFAEAISDQLASSIGLPRLPLLADARDILIVSPPLLVLINGNFNSVTLHTQTAKLGMKQASYQGVALWIPADTSTLGIAQLNDQLLLAGSRAALQSAIDRSQSERRHYSPLLARAARYAEADLWVVADKLPDPLASIFVPLDVPDGSGGFEGYATLRNGLTISASLDAGSEENAEAMAQDLQESAPSLPPIAQALEAKVDGRNVFFSLSVEIADSIEPSAAVPPQPAAQPAPPPKPEPAPTGPQVIRIFGLDDGPREIKLPPAKPDKPLQN